LSRIIAAITTIATASNKDKRKTRHVKDSIRESHISLLFMHFSLIYTKFLQTFHTHPKMIRLSTLLKTMHFYDTRTEFRTVKGLGGSWPP
jgi:hypothetical protein